MTAIVRSCTTVRARRILVVAPHPDDEALGCGGLIHALARRGENLHVVFVTDGGASHPNSPSWSRSRLAGARAEEATEALRRLGAGNASRTFLRLPDADMPVRGTTGYEGALSQAVAIVRDLSPDLALLPWRRDPHRDHRDAWSLFTEAFERAAARPQTLEYAIWLDEIGAPDDHPRPDEMARACFDVAASVVAKRAAVEAHRTQTTALIDDDPGAFRLTESTIHRLSGPIECYWQPLR